MTTRQRGPLSFFVAVLATFVVGLTTASPSAAATVAPAAPVLLSTVVGVDGVTLRWFQGSTTAGTPTSYVVHRRAAGYDADWVVPTGLSPWSYADGGAPVGVDVTYTVTARNSAGDSPESEPVTARVPVWSGPYNPDRVSLTLVWDEAAPGDDTQRSTVVADATTVPALTAAPGNGGTSFTTGSWREELVLPPGVADGTYPVGPGDGQLPIRAIAGASCVGPAGASVPGGTATVAHGAPSMNGTYASVSVDADLDCANGHRLRAQLRWHTPEPASMLSTAALSVVTAGPGDTATTTITVTNRGSEDLRLGAARFVDADLSTSAPLAVVASTCDGLVLAPVATCSLTVRYTAGSGGSPEGRGVIALATDVGEWELGTVVGQQPAAWAGPQSFAASSSPGRVDLSWQAPTTLDSRLIAGWRVEDVSSGSPVALPTKIATYARSTNVGPLSVGPHSLRLVLLTTDGRAVPSAAVRVSIPSRWLLVTTSTGLRAYDPDGGMTNGGLVGGRSSAVDGIATSPTRAGIVASDGVAAGTRVWLLGPAGEQTRIVTSTSSYPDADPDVSPEGSTVALVRRDPAGSVSLLTVPVSGGAVTAVPNSTGLFNPVWTPDGAALVAVTGSGTLVRIDRATGTRTTIPGTSGAQAVAVSRTGRVAFTVRSSTSTSYDVRVTSLAGGTSTVVASHDIPNHLSWDPTGGWLAVTGAPWSEQPMTQVVDLRSATPVPGRSFPGGISVAWFAPASVAPVASVTVPAWTTSSASLNVGATDADDAPGGLHRECRLDAAAWNPCSAAWKVTGLGAGTHSAAVRVTDPSGQVSPVVQRSWSVDTQAPSVALTALPSVVTSTSLKLGWAAKDTGGSGAATVDVRYRSAPLNTTFGSLTYPSTWSGLKGTTLATTLAAGREYCFSARARDIAGNVGAWSGERCTVVTLDDRSLTASSGWTRGSSAAYAYGTYSRATSSARTLTRTSVQARRLAIVVTTCSTCGAVDVYHAGVKLGRVSLYSATTAYRQVRWLPLQSVTRTGTVILKTTSTKATIVDGLAALH